MQKIADEMAETDVKDVRTIVNNINAPGVSQNEVLNLYKDWASTYENEVSWS